jgi:hypothetical protein
VGTGGATVFSSLLVVVILGAVTAQITRWCLVSTQPATEGLDSHRTGGVLPALAGIDAGTGAGADDEAPRVVEEHPVVASVEPLDEDTPVQTAPFEAAPFEDAPFEVDEALPVAGAETTATSWLSRARAVVGLTVVVSALGAVLAVAVASTALLTAAVLDSALG